MEVQVAAAAAPQFLHQFGRGLVDVADFVAFFVLQLDFEGFALVLELDRLDFALGKLAADQRLVAVLAVVGRAHDKWGERPVAAVVCKNGHSVTKEELAAHLDGKFAKFWLPDEYLFIDQIPKTSTGKFKKLDLRARYGEYLVTKR